MPTRTVTCLTLTAVLVASNGATAGSPKRGWAGGDADDHNASNASWYYRWWHTIPPDANGTLAEFIPLIKFPNNIQSKVDIVAAFPDVDTLLVLNEPERPDQSDTTVAEALSIWPTIQSGLPNHKLVSPGVSDNAAGQAWLLDFMNQVELANNNADPNDDLRVDAIAFHWYGASAPNPVSAANNFLNRVDWYHTTFGLPVWITEFAMHDWEGDDPTAAMIQANADFLEIVLPELESRSYVERYSYYNWFDDAMIFEDPDRMPTVIGDQYVETTLAGETRDLAGQSVGTDTAYLRGGNLTNTGAAIPEAMRAIDALDGINTISGTTDWSLSDLRDNITRVRSGATLRKTGPNTIGLTGALDLEGDLEVAEGTLVLAGLSPVGPGAIRVQEGATLEIPAGRTVYTVPARDFVTSGVVDGVIRFASGANVTAEGTAPTFTSDVTIVDSTLDVGGAGFTNATPAVQPVTTQLRLDYNAALDTPGDAVWSEAGGSSDDFNFAGPATPAAVSDAGFPGIGAAYEIGQVGAADGLNQFFESGGPQISRQDATFEVVFRVDDTGAGSDQVLLEVGGVGRGVAFVLDGDTLKFNVDGDGGDIDLTAVVGAGWNHAVGVIDLAGGGDSVSLFVNGQAAGVVTNQTIVDWAGGNISGIGAGANSVTGVSSGLGAPYHGAVAIARYYENYTFDGADALQNYQALTTAPLVDPTTVSVDGDLVVQSASDLRFDIGDGGAADSISIGGALTVTGGTLSVAYVGQGDLAAGDAFDLFDFATALVDFDSVALPQLAASLRWRLDRLAIDGAIEVVLAGDLNADGSVDAADYTLLRDSFGASVLNYTAGDSNGDGLVDAADLAEWQANFGATAQAASAVIPEPSGLWLVASLLLAGTWGARR